MSAHIETASAELRRFAAGLSFLAPRSAAVLRGLADALRTDPDIAAAFAGEVMARPVAGIRLVAGLHDLVLSGRLPALRELMYPADPDAPPPSPEAVWALAREAFREHAGQLRAALEWQVQQHGPDRAGVLLRGLAMLTRVVRASAGEWLRQRLAETPDPDVHTVVWHSQLWHLLDRAEQEDIRAMSAQAADRFPVSRIYWEPLRVGRRAALCIEDYS